MIFEKGGQGPMFPYYHATPQTPLGIFFGLRFVPIFF